MRGTLAFIVNRFKAGLLERSFAETLVDQLAATDMVGLKRAEEETSSHPVTARFERRNAEGTIEIDTLRARYVVGCDGSRSMVRQSIGRALHGDSANQAWGVMDVLAVTDFPDVRFKSLIQSDGEGSILVIPREGGYLVRLYVELDKLNINEQVGARNITIEQLIAAHSASRPMGHPCIQVGSRRWLQHGEREGPLNPRTDLRAQPGLAMRADERHDPCGHDSIAGGDRPVVGGAQVVPLALEDAASS